MDAEARRRLAELVSREIDSPGSLPNALDELRERFPGEKPLFEFLAAKDDQHRHAFYVKSMHAGYRKLGWRIMRPLMIVAVLAAVAFSLQRRIDPTLGIACFLGGAAAFYVVLQIFLSRWADRELEALDAVHARYRERLRPLLEELRGGKA